MTQVQTTQDTKAGTSTISGSAPQANQENKFATDADISKFFEALHQAKNDTAPGEVPAMEAPKRVVFHFNQGLAAQGVKKMGYFVYQGVKVYEEGRRKEAERRDALTSEDKMHGAGR